MSGSLNRQSKKKKRERETKTNIQLLGIESFCPLLFIFWDCLFLLHFHNVFCFSSAQVIPSQLLRIFNNPFASLLSPHGDLIEFHNLSNIAPDENVLWPRWHIGLHLKGFRAAGKFFFFFFCPAAKTKQQKVFSPPFGSWMNICLLEIFLMSTSFCLLLRWSRVQKTLQENKQHKVKRLKEDLVWGRI